MRQRDAAGGTLHDRVSEEAGERHGAESTSTPSEHVAAGERGIEMASTGMHEIGLSSLRWFDLRSKHVHGM